MKRKREREREEKRTQTTRNLTDRCRVSFILLYIFYNTVST